MKLFSLSLIVFVLGIAAYFNSKIHEKETDYCGLVNRLQNQHAKEMWAEGYTLRNSGGELCADVTSIFIGFYSKKRPTIDEVRRDYVKGVERFLALINNDESVRPYLHDFPFRSHNLSYSMSFPRLPTDASDNTPVAFVFNCNGMVIYDVYDSTLTDTNPLRTIRKETYSEALRIVREAGLLTNKQ